MKRERGFTLLEALVALAIMAIGLAAAMRTLAEVTRSAEELRERQLAEWVAKNHLAELRVVDRFPALGVTHGEAIQGGRRFLWREEVTQSPNLLFRRVDVEISAFGAKGALSRLSGYAVHPQR